MFRLSTLGSLRLDGSAGPLAGAATRRRPLALLAVIAASGQRGITRDRLIGLLWPERDEAQARHVLAQTLYALRKDLGAEELVLNGGALRLNPSVITSDLQDFTSALELGDRNRAIAQYAGPFLEGFYLSDAPEFERWVEEERASLQVRFRTALEGAATEAAEHPATAAALWSRLSGLDPLASRPVANLARALIAAGDSGEALRRIRAHRAVAEQEGVAVSSDVVRLEAELTSKPAPSNATRPAPPVPPPSVTRFRPHHWSLPFVMVAGLLLVIVITLRGTTRRVVPVVAVGMIESHLSDDSLGLARALPDLITTQLAQVEGLTVVSRGRLLEVLGTDVRLPGSGILARGARAAGAGEILEGAVYSDEGEFRLDLRRVDLRDGKVTAAVSVTGQHPSDVVDRAAASLAGSFGLKPPVAPIASITSISLAARRLYEEGLRAYYSGDRPMASRLFDAALDDDSTFAMAAYYLALTQVGAFPDSEAVYWRRAVRLAPRALDRERLLIQAAAAFSLNDVRALALAETLTVRYPDDMDGKRILGEQRFSEGNFPGSIAAFLSVVEADSAGRLGRAARCRACDAISSAVWVSMTADSLDRAERLTRDLISWNPRTAPNYALLGTVLQRRWRFDEAMDAYRRQVELTPGGGLSAAAMHMALRRGDFVVFDSIVTKLLRYAENPLERLDGLSWQASLLRETSRPRESLRVARQARHLSDSLNGGKTAHAFVMLPEALALLDLGVSDPASARAASAVFDSMAGMPTYPEPRMARHRVWMWTHQATALARARDTAALPALEQRIAETARLSSYGRDRKMPFYVRGLLLEARKDWAGAAAAYSQAIWSPTDNHVAPILAHALLESGQPARAIPVLHAWLRGPLDAANQYVPRASAHQALAEAFAATGQADSAAVHRAWVHRSIAISRKP